LTPEKISELTGRPLAEVRSDLRNSSERGVLAHKLSVLEEVKRSSYGSDVKKLEEHLGLLNETLERKKSWLGKGWDRVKGVFQNKWVKRGAIVAAIAALAYFGIKYYDVNNLLSKTKEGAALGAAKAKAIAYGSASGTAAPLDTGITGGAGAVGGYGAPKMPKPNPSPMTDGGIVDNPPE